MKRIMKWIIPVAVVMLLTVAMVLTFSGCNREQDDGSYEIYWNVDRGDWVGDDQISTRMASGDGKYRIRFAVNGEQVDLFVTSQEMMQKADSMLFMGLEVNEYNEVTNVLDPYEFSGGWSAFAYYIESFDDTTIQVNSMSNFRGQKMELKYNAETEIYAVGGSGLLVGLPTQLQVGGEIYAVQNYQGITTHIFLMPPFEKTPVYWNVVRMYDSASKTTTRERDVTGNYIYEFAVDGELVQLRTKDNKVASAIDSFAAKCMHLEFDEEGYITGATHARYSTGGASRASWHHVISMDELNNTFYAEKFAGSDKGSAVTCRPSADCKVYDVSGTGAYVGEPTEVRLYDQIHCVTDTAGDVCVVFIVSRAMDCDLYYNLNRMWDSSAKVSTRRPAADGYYYFDMSVNGSRTRVKTSDPEIVKTIDSRGACVVGLELDGNVITAAHAPSAVSGCSVTLFDYCDVVRIEKDGTIVCQRNGNTFKAKAAEDCEVYDVSKYAGVKGQKTNIRVGDKLYGVGNLKGELTNVYVVSRPVYSKLYWNLERNYDSKNKVTKRTPAADGYYYFNMVVDSKVVTVKTKSKTVANELDSYVAAGLYLNGDEITRVFKYDVVNGYTGGGFASWAVVNKISGRSVTAVENSGKSHSGTMAYNCKVYNVSSTAVNPGEVTKLQVGDRIHGIRNKDKVIVAIFVVSRPIQSPIYWNLDRDYDTTNGVSRRTPDADGYYYIDLVADTVPTTVKTKDKAIVDQLDSFVAVGLYLNGDEITKVFKYDTISGYTGGGFASWTNVSAIDGNQVTAGGYTGTMTDDCKVYNVSKTATNRGELTTLQVGDRIHGIKDSNGKVAFIYVVERFVTKTAYCQACQKEATFKSWDGKSALSTGHYFLEKDITVSVSGNIADKNTVCLDLNGKTITGASTLDRIFNIYGNFNLMDEKNADGTYSGNVIATYNNANGRSGSVFYVQNTGGFGIFKMYGGNLKATGQTKNGGIGGIGAEFYMYDGTISGGKAAQNGGNLYMEKNSTSKFFMYGGTITGGTAGNASDGVRGAGPIVLGGTAKITGNNGNDLLVMSGVSVSIDSATPLATGANIGILLESGTTVALNAKSGDEQYFKSADGKQVIYDNGKLVLKVDAHESHCICGGVGKLGDHTTCTNVTWEPWTGTWESGKYYYLTGETTLTSTLTIDAGKTLNLCLNGQKLKGSVRLLNIIGTLNLCDHTGEGTVTSTATGMAPVFYVRDGATFNLYGGKLIGTDRARSGVGAIGDSSSSADNGTMNIYGGQLVGAKVTGSGGAMEMFHKSKLNIYGGTITGGEASASGSAIYCGAGTIQMLGGTITGGTSNGGSLYMGGKLILGGDAKISGGNTNLYLKDGVTVTLQELKTDALIYVTMAKATGVFATGAVEANVSNFRSDALSQITYADGKLSITGAVAPAHEHCVCSGLGKVGDHTTCTSVTWEPWTGTWESGKYYYLTGPYNVSATIEVGSGKTLNLCLNGYDINGGADVDRLFNINAGTLNLCDHKKADGTYDGDVVSNYTGTKTRTGRVFYIQNYEGSVFNLYGGNLRSTQSTKNGGIGGITRIFRMYGGTISGGVATGNGGNLMLEGAYAEVTLYGGKISNSTTATCANLGGNIYVNYGKLILDGATVEGGKATGSGGNIRIASGGIFELKSGTVTGGVSGINAGNIYCEGQMTVSGGEVTNGSGTLGSNIYWNTTAYKLKLVGKLTLTGVHLNQGKVDASGLLAGSKIGINMTTVGVLADSGDASCFNSEKSGYVVSKDGTSLVMKAQ